MELKKERAETLSLSFYKIQVAKPLGNLSRIPAVREFFSSQMALDPLFFGVLSCQAISNVPSAVLLSHFTEDFRRLLIAVNLGGLGTPVASFASLITLNTCRALDPIGTRRYLAKFLLFNFSFLLVLFGISYMTVYFVL